MAVSSTSGWGRRPATAASRSSIPSPVAAEIIGTPGSRRLRRARVTSSSRSALLRTSSSGTSAAPTSPRTDRTAAICPAGSGWAASTRWTIRSARATSSRVDLNASTRSWGSLAMNPTVSVKVAARPPGRSRRRVVGSRVENSLSSTSTPALDVPGPGHVDQVPAELGDAAADAAPVDLHLGLARAAGADRPARAHAAADPGQALTPAPQPGQHVVELGQLDLGLAFAAGGVLGEDVEDQHRAVDHLGVDQLLQVPELPGRQLVVHDDGVGPERLDGGGQLLGLALADEGAGVGPGPALDHGVEHLGPGRVGQPVQLLDRALGLLDRPDGGGP